MVSVREKTWARRILEAEEEARQLAEMIRISPPVVRPPIKFKETPRALSYFYAPHQYKTVKAGEHEEIYSFTVPPAHVFHIEQLANNWFEDTAGVFEIDGAVVERVERFIASINAPLDVRGRYFAAFSSVRWVTYNNSADDIISEVLIDGRILHAEDWSKVVGRFW